MKKKKKKDASDFNEGYPKAFLNVFQQLKN